MTGFDLQTPVSLAEAIGLLNTDDTAVRAFSGGTALMLMMKSRVFQPSMLVNLRRIEPGYRNIATTPDGGLRIGAMASLREIELSEAVAHVAPSVTAAMPRLSNVRVRNVARIGGALAHGDPHMDMPPVLASLGGSVTLEGPGGRRSVAIQDLFKGYYETVLKQGELITEAVLPPQEGWRSVYKKLTTRSADDWPTLGVAVSLKLRDGTVEDIRIMIAAATEKLTRLVSAERELRGQRVDGASALQAAEAAMSEVETVEDVRGSASYKRELAGVLVRRALVEAAAVRSVTWTH